MQSFLKKKIVLLSLVLIGTSILVGGIFLGNRQYYLVSLLVLILAMTPFVLMFEKRKPEAKELVLVSALCALAIAGRVAFFMLPQVKPLVALIIVSGIVFGSETGFLVGAMSGFVSNFFFGQGPWTAWQMFALALIGVVSGVLFQKGRLAKNRFLIALFGGVVTLVLYGGVMNFSSAMMVLTQWNAKLIASYYVVGFPFDLVHAVSTVLFLFLFGNLMIEKLERVKKKYGLMEEKNNKMKEGKRK